MTDETRVRVGGETCAVTTSQHAIVACRLTCSVPQEVEEEAVAVMPVP